MLQCVSCRYWLALQHGAPYPISNNLAGQVKLLQAHADTATHPVWVTNPSSVNYTIVKNRTAQQKGWDQVKFKFTAVDENH